MSSRRIFISVKGVNLYICMFPGRSMGARAAVAVGRVMCAEHEDAVQGLLCLSFPLHPPGQTHTHIQRSQDLCALSRTPVLFVSGTADNMCEQVIMVRSGIMTGR